jgi:hypothetical protein
VSAPLIGMRSLRLLDTDFTYSVETVFLIAMFTHICARAPMYLVAGSAGLLAVLALIGLFTDLLGIRQILVLAIALVAAIELSLVWDRRLHR